MAILSKNSKSKLRSEPGTPKSEVSTPPLGAEGFKSLFKKKASSSSPASPAAKGAPLYQYGGPPGVQPRPILRPPPVSSPSSMSSPRVQRKPVSPTAIRFAGYAASGEYRSTPSTPVTPRSAVSPPKVVVTPSAPVSTPVSAPSPTPSAPAQVSPAIPARHPSRPCPQRASTLPTPTSPAVRRSSRPTSPAASSFGARQRTSIASTISPSSTACRSPLSPASPTSSVSSVSSAASSSDSCRVIPLQMKPQSQDVFTPPSNHSASFPPQPLSSPYRPTSTRSQEPDGTVHPQRTSSLMSQNGSASPRLPVPTIPTSSLAFDESVPMLNVIPATPQEDSEDFSEVEHPTRQEVPAAIEPAVMEDVEVVDESARAKEVSSPEVHPADEEDIEVASLADFAVRHLQQLEASDHSQSTSPKLDLSLSFSPFAPLDLRPSSPIDLSFSFNNAKGSANEAAEVQAAAAAAVASSPPFESWPSLPSLASHASGSASVHDLASLELDSCEDDSEDSLGSFPDVEAALGHMLASLSDVRLSDLPELPEVPAHHLPALPPTPKLKEEGKDTERDVNLGLGFGLGLGLDISSKMSTVSSTTAPLKSPRRKRRVPPPPLDLGRLPRLPPAGTFASEDDIARRRDLKRLETQPKMPNSAPLYDHRRGFYRSSPTSATSTLSTTSGRSSASSHSVRSAGRQTDHMGSMPSFGTFKMDTANWVLPHDGSRSRLAVEVENDAAYDGYVGHKRTGSVADSISMSSEASDDDVHTASIISLTPILASNGRVHVREEVLEADVGVAF